MNYIRLVYYFCSISPFSARLQVYATCAVECKYIIKNHSMTSHVLPNCEEARTEVNRSEPEDWPFASVIIPVYNDSEGLARCLASLDEQTYPEDRYEVIAVDNNSSESIDDALARCAQARSVFEKTPGSYAARNRGLATARGDVLAFTDADCRPEASWLENGVRALKQMDEPGLVGGRVEFCFQNPGHPLFFELVETSLFLNQKASVQRRHFAVTANMFTTRVVVDKLGPFDAALQSGGDREWGQRAHQAGLSVQYAPDACVQHSTRDSAEALFKKVRRVTKGQHDLRMQRSGGLQVLLREILDLALPPVRTIRRLLADQRVPWSTRLQAVALLLKTRLWQIVEKLRMALETNGVYVPRQ